MKKTIFAIAASMFFAVAAAQANAQTINISVGKAGLKKGGTSRAYVVMKIPDGLHVNSFQPKSEYAVPTRVRVSAQGANIGRISYPAGQMKKFSFSEEPISVYEGTVRFGFNITVPRAFADTFVKITAEVDFQACTDEVCYPPKTKTVVLNVRAR